jgi:hypothetical protein
MVYQTCPAYPVSIFIAGSVEEAEMICRAYCDEVGLCVTVTETNYCYTGGKEAGLIVGFINYARFPSDPAEIERKAKELADRLREGLGQQTYTIQTPSTSHWFSWRL